MTTRRRCRVAIATLIFALLCIIAVTVIIFSFPSKQLQPARPSKPLILVWELADPNTEPSKIGALSPVQIVSPTWFKIVDETGAISNEVDQEYIDWAKNRGYKIWALVSNSFDPDITAAILSDPQIWQSIINELIDLALEYELDGLNIDFENFHYDYRDLFTGFISELALQCRKSNLILSVDVTMISSSEYWSLGYDRPALAAVADYLILMAYDEHWQASPTAGSVASLPWVENGLQQILQDVPAEKLILGVPFYTRLWEICKSGDSPVVLNSRSYSMHRAGEIIAENNAEIFWDSNARQNVAFYRKNGLTYKMWLEDVHSMQQRLELVNKYALAGVAGWRRGLETKDIWDLFNQLK